MLEQDGGVGWKLILRLLARGRLFDENKENPIKISGRRLLKDFHHSLFEDTYIQNFTQ
jgi:hypothetical protein